MAQREPRPAKRGRPVPLWLALLVALLLLVPIVWALFPREAPLQEALYDPSADQALTIRYGERDWVPEPEPVPLRDETMRAVGESEGYAIYAIAPTGGGGGEAPPAGDRIYLKVGEDRYVPMRLKAAKPAP